MIFVDTGYLIALLDRSDQPHAVARAWARVVKEEMLTTSFVFAEFFNYFSGSSLRVEADKFCDFLDSKPEFNSLHVDASLYERGRTLHRDRPDKA